MDKNRVILATVLSFIVIIGWTYLFPPPPPQQAPATAPATTQTIPPIEGATQPLIPGVPVPGAPAFTGTIATGERITVATPLFTARLNAQGGLLENFTLSQFRETIQPGSANINLVSSAAMQKAPMGLIWSGQPTWMAEGWSFEGSDLNLAPGEEGVLRFALEFAGLRLLRELTFSGDSYLVRETVRVQSLGDQAAVGRLAFTMASTGLSNKGDSYNPTRMEWYSLGKLHEEGDLSDLAQGVVAAEALSWGGLSSNYFLVALAPTFEGAVFKGKHEEEIYRMAVEKDGIVAAPGVDGVAEVAYYFGPKSPKLLAPAGFELDKSVNYGMFSFIAEPLLWLLDFFHGMVGNWGVAIILLTVVIKIVFWPLSHKSYKSMMQMKKLQPMMMKIREKHADDRQKMNQEIMQLYKTYKVNPLGGCLPMLLQIPVFFGLYQALLLSTELRHAAFISHVPFTDIIWLADLSAKDPFYITPLIMGASMFLQQKMAPAPGDPVQAKIMLFMPIIFTALFLSFPSGLVIYWLVNNILSIFQQWLMMRKA